MSLPLMGAQPFCLKIDLRDGNEMVIPSTIPEAVVHCHMVQQAQTTVVYGRSVAKATSLWSKRMFWYLLAVQSSCGSYS